LVILVSFDVSAETAGGALGFVIVQHKFYSVSYVIAKCCDEVS
jgi:hypothetical protein